MSDPTNPFVLVPGDPMTARDEAERAIAEVLAGHAIIKTGDLVSLLADLVADGQAKAWSEGYAEGIIHMGMSIEDHGKQPGNPYRRTPEGETRE